MGRARPPDRISRPWLLHSCQHVYKIRGGGGARCLYSGYLEGAAVDDDTKISFSFQNYPLDFSFIAFFSSCKALILGGILIIDSLGSFPPEQLKSVSFGVAGAEGGKLILLAQI